MRFLCENCKSKYTIGDGKIRNRVLKIRCRKCGGIIEIHDPDLTTTRLDLARAAAGYGRHVGPDEQVSTKKSSADLPPPPESIEKKEVDLVHWFVGIASAPFGPISARVVHSNREEERIDDESLVWREGMPEWVPLRKCKELIGLLAAIDIEQAFSGEMADVAAKAGVEGVARQRSTTGMGPSADGVDAAVAQPERSVDVPDSPAKDASGMIDEFDDLDKPSSIDFEKSQEVIRAVVEKQRRRSDSKFLKVMVGGFFLVAVAVFVYVVFVYKAPPPEKEFVEKVVYRDRVVEVQVPGQPVAGSGDAQSGANGKSSKRRKSSTRKSKNKKSEDVDSDAKIRQLMAQMGESGAARDVELGRGPQAPGRDETSRKGTLAESDIARVVNKNKPRLKICYERALRTKEAPEDRDIRVNVAFKVGSSGLVKDLKLSGSAANIASLKQCLSKALSRWVFPASSEQSAPVEFPVLFTPK